MWLDELFRRHRASAQRLARAGSAARLPKRPRQGQKPNGRDHGLSGEYTVLDTTVEHRPGTSQGRCRRGQLTLVLSTPCYDNATAVARGVGDIGDPHLELVIDGAAADGRAAGQLLTVGTEWRRASLTRLDPAIRRASTVQLVPPGVDKQDERRTR